MISVLCYYSLDTECFNLEAKTYQGSQKTIGWFKIIIKWKLKNLLLNILLFGADNELLCARPCID